MPRILLTRSVLGNEAWAGRLAAQGIDSLGLPCLRHEKLSDPETRRAMVELWRSCSWLALTSRRGAESAAELLREEMLREEVLREEVLGTGPAIAAVGPATADRCRELFGRCELVSEEPTGAGLARELRRRLAPGTAVAIATADRGRRDLEEILEPAGLEVRRLAVYETLTAEPATERLDLAEQEVDGIFFASPSALEGLGALARWPDSWAAERIAVAIGPTTARAVEAGGFRVWIAERPSFGGMLAAWKAAIGPKASARA